MPDGGASLIAVAGFGLALLGFVTMAGIAVALGVSPPNEFWLLGTSIAGVLTGILVPPTKAKQEEQAIQAAQAAFLATLEPQERLKQLTAKAGNPAPAAAGPSGKTGWEPVDKWFVGAAGAASARAGEAAPPAQIAPPPPPQKQQWLSRITPSDWRLAILGGLFVVAGGVGLWFLNAPYQGSTQLFAVAGVSGATALGILVPPPKPKSSG